MTRRTQPTAHGLHNTTSNEQLAPRTMQYAIRSTHHAPRLGSTSAVYPDDVLPNVYKLAGKVADIEWVVFETTYGLPEPAVVAEMARLAAEYGHSYTVHLPLELPLVSKDERLRQVAIATASQVIALARPLEPWAYIVHLEGEGLTLPSPQSLIPNPRQSGGPSPFWCDWHERAAVSLATLGKAAGSLERLAIENLPNYPAEHLFPLLKRLPVSMCLDIGHLLDQGRDPRPLLVQHPGRLRVVHLHGVEGGKDHRSVRAMDRTLLRDLLLTLHQADYCGVVTLELFDAAALWESWGIVEEVWRVVTGGKRGNE